MPAIGGLKIAFPPELWAKVQELVIEGLPYKQIAQETGISESCIRSKAAQRRWTVAKAEKKAEKQLETLRPQLHAHLTQLTKRVKTPQTSSAKQLKPVADLVLALANGAKLVEGWKEEETNCLVNVLQISNSVTANPDVGTEVAVDAEVVDTTEDYSI
jgi:hypothetical protein